MMQRLFVVALTGALLVACGDGGQKIPNPPPGGNERPTESAERPATGSEVIPDQRPAENPERPVSSPLPGPGLGAPASGAGGSGNEGPGNGNAGRGNGNAGSNSGPGNDCTLANQCSGCDTNCDACHCADLGDDICDQLCP